MQELSEYAESLYNIHLSAEQTAQFAIYERELMAWNERFNLTAIRTIEGIRIKHFVDSLSCVPFLRDQPGLRVIDIGTGAGFPGLPIKIALPEIQLTVVESVGKKASFCRHVIQQLGLQEVEVINERAEVLGQVAAHRQQYHWAIARAVAALPVLCEYLLPLVRVGGGMIAMKGQAAQAEAAAAAGAMQRLGGKLQHLLAVELPLVDETHWLVIIEKTAPTPTKYPRRAGVPAQKPLN